MNILPPPGLRVTGYRLRAQRGLAIPELLVGIFVLATLTVAIASLAALGTRSAARNEYNVTAQNLVKESIEKIVDLPYKDVGCLSEDPQNPPSVIGTIDCDEDDVVRNNLHYRRTTTVLLIDDPLTPTKTDDYKQVTVKLQLVAGVQGGPALIQEVVTLVSPVCDCDNAPGSTSTECVPSALSVALPAASVASAGGGRVAGISSTGGAGASCNTNGDCTTGAGEVCLPEVSPDDDGGGGGGGGGCTCPNGQACDPNGLCPGSCTCPSGLQCDVNGQCPDPPPSCTCPGGLACDPNGLCPGSSSGGDDGNTCPNGQPRAANGQCSCETSCECTAGESCNASTKTCVPPCIEGSICPATGTLCPANHICPPPTCPDGSPRPANGQCAVCAVDEDCGSDFICDEDTCVTPVDCTPTTGCLGGKFCVNNTCREEDSAPACTCRTAKGTLINNTAVAHLVNTTSGRVAAATDGVGECIPPITECPPGWSLAGRICIPDPPNCPAPIGLDAVCPAPSVDICSNGSQKITEWVPAPPLDVVVNNCPALAGSSFCMPVITTVECPPPDPDHNPFCDTDNILGTNCGDPNIPPPKNLPYPNDDNLSCSDVFGDDEWGEPMRTECCYSLDTGGDEPAGGPDACRKEGDACKTSTNFDGVCDDRINPDTGCTHYVCAGAPTPPACNPPCGANEVCAEGGNCRPL